MPCDRVGLALLAEDGKEFQTYTARVQNDDGPRRARPEVVFKVERTMIGGVVRSREPLIVEDMNAAAPDYLDANVVVTAGFRSALIIPLVSNERAVGTLNLVGRKPGLFERRHVEPLQAIAEILAVTWVAQQLQQTVGKYRMAEVMSEATLAIAAEINSALQTIVGHCDIMLHTSEDAGIKRDVSTDFAAGTANRRCPGENAEAGPREPGSSARRRQPGAGEPRTSPEARRHRPAARNDRTSDALSSNDDRQRRPHEEPVTHPDRLEERHRHAHASASPAVRSTRRRAAAWRDVRRQPEREARGQRRSR